MGLKHRHSYESVTSRLLAEEKHYIASSFAGDLSVALIFPNLYDLGMSNLGFLTVHRLLNSIPGLCVERFFPALEPDAPLKPPYYSFETARPLGDFQILMFSFSYEGDFEKIPGIFSALGIPVRASERNRFHPLLIAGGAAVASNHHALSAIFDILVPGEAETTLVSMISSIKQNGADYSILAEIPGVFAAAAGLKMQPVAIMHDINQSPAWSHIVAPSNAFGGAHLLEIMRGCPRNCSFCLARCIYAPARPLEESSLIKTLEQMPECKDLGLVAPSLFDHPQIDRIFAILNEKNIRIRNSSVKWEKLSPEILSSLRKSGVTSLTLAPETGSEKLRAAIKKPLKESVFFDSIRIIFDHGFEHLKLYFVACLPGEENEDIDATITFIEKVVKAAPGQGSISAAFSIFVPKNYTPWASEKAPISGVVKRKLKYYKDKLNKISGNFKFSIAGIQEAQRQAYLSTVGPELADEYAREAKLCREDRLFGKNQFSIVEF